MALIDCPNCGAKISDKADHCVKCGIVVTKVNRDMSDVLKQSYRQEQEEAHISPAPATKKKKTKLIIIGCAVAAVVIAGVFLTIYLTGRPSDIQLSKHSETVDVGNTVTLSYHITPERSQDAEVDWRSSNPDVATVENGSVVGVSEGDCEITVTTKNGIRDTCVLKVEPEKPDFNALYNKFCDPDWASVSPDGSSLTIDTNPNDRDNYSSTEAYVGVMRINEAVGFSSAVLERMESTRALDGTQTASSKTVEASWTYHPDRGLRIVYSLVK